MPFVGIEQPFHLAGVPDDHRARAILALRDHALERAVLDRMVLRAHGEALHVGIEGRALRHRPAHQHAVMLKPEIVVQPRRRVLLHDEHAAGVFQLAAGGFARLLEVALAVVLGEIADRVRLWPLSSPRLLRRGRAYFFARLAAASPALWRAALSCARPRRAASARALLRPRRRRCFGDFFASDFFSASTSETTLSP